VAHLPPGPGLRLVVEVEPDTGQPERVGPAGLSALPELAQQVDHRHRRQQPRLPERQTAEGAKLLLELIHRAGVHGEMAAIVRPRRHLVDEQSSAVRDEQLHTEHAGVLHSLRHPHREAARLVGQPLGDTGRHHGRLEDAVPMPVLPDGEDSISPSDPRASTTDSSVSSDSRSSRTQATRPNRSNAAVADAASVTSAWPLPS
jgi:hypothetical protein